MLPLLPPLVCLILGLSGDETKKTVPEATLVAVEGVDAVLGLVGVELFDPDDLLDFMDRRRAVFWKRDSGGTSNKEESLAAE